MKKKILLAFTALLLILPGLSLGEAYVYPVEMATPTEADISKDDAISIAKNETTERQGLAPGALDGYPNATNFVTLENGENAWVVSIFFTDEFPRMMSVLVISPADGAVIEYQASDTGLDYEILQRWEERKGEYLSWSLEDQALFDMLYRENNTAAIPGEGMLSQEEAAAIALNAVPQSFSKPTFLFEFWKNAYSDGTEQDVYTWVVVILEGGEKKYQVNLSAVDGTIVLVHEWGTGVG
jgi:hypothetical protein